MRRILIENGCWSRFGWLVAGENTEDRVSGGEYWSRYAWLVILWVVLPYALSASGSTDYTLSDIIGVEIDNHPVDVGSDRPIEAKTAKLNSDNHPVQPRPVRTEEDLRSMLEKISEENIGMIIEKLVSFHTRHTLSDTVSETVGIGAARRWIYQEMQRYSRESGGRLQVEYHRFIQPPARRIPVATEIVNIVATLPGVQKESVDRIYVVSGHYDSICGDQLDVECYAPGANDDASGTAAVMELARVMSHYAFDATIIFMAVAGEEQGLYGAHQWAQEALDNRLNIQGMITNDIIGSSLAEDGTYEPYRVRLFAAGIPALQENSRLVQAYLRTGGENDMPIRQLARHIKDAGERYVEGMQVDMIYRQDRYLRGGDHMAFVQRGFPAVRFSEPNENYRHQHQYVREEDGVMYGDLPEFVDNAYVARVAMVNGAALATLALAPAPPSNTRMMLHGLSNDTVITWDANTEPDLKGYRIVWRETTSPVWQWSRDVGNVTEATMEGLSKDNFIFGVQAYDANGFVSPAVYPLP